MGVVAATLSLQKGLIGGGLYAIVLLATVLQALVMPLFIKRGGEMEESLRTRRRQFRTGQRSYGMAPHTNFWTNVK
ncbi:hypothetical protein [Thermogymnomonas acidicola]|uniref:hypothetical protein n=1 Tax=Thermogymnomonas acidicola TaxID=399579 RepID=UPI001396B561|nr:hypothetical protein [Thermogymnomonas acidicola]